jgi:diguanylate cyclase (GGDEF)-like protein
LTHRVFSILYLILLSCVFNVSLYAEEPPIPKTLVIANSKAWKPFSYLENGQPKGLLIDFWRLYGERTGTNIIFNLVDWQESLDLTAQGDANIHAGLLYSKARAESFEFGSVLFNVQSSVYIDINLINVIDDDLSNLKHPLGLVLGGYQQGLISELYPNIPLITYANNALMFEAVRKREISVFVADKQVANFYMVSFPEHLNDFITLKKLYDEPIRFAVPKGDFMLLRIVEAQLKMLSKGDVEQIKQKWINTETKVPIWFYNSLFFSLLLVAVTYIFFLRKAVAKRTLQLAIVNEKLTLQANSDVLTGLYNRRFLTEYLERTQYRIHKGGFAVLMIDIDFFKLINDTYGHPVGDIVLAILAKRMQSCVREQDILARIGGEEFCVVLEGVSIEKMREISREFNKNIASSPFNHKDEQLDITISIGALHIQHHQKWSASDALQQADKLLYHAKDNGRNQTVCGEFT